MPQGQESSQGVDIAGRRGSRRADSCVAGVTGEMRRQLEKERALQEARSLRDMLEASGVYRQLRPTVDPTDSRYPCPHP